jgi:hypothetical protein
LSFFGIGRAVAEIGGVVCEVKCPFRGRTLSVKDREGKNRVNLASILALFLNSLADYYS